MANKLESETKTVWDEVVSPMLTREDRSEMPKSAPKIVNVEPPVVP